MTNPSVIIVGSGIAGLSAAYYLTRRKPGIKVLLLEREGRIGGKILSQRFNGFVVEGGPDSFLSSKEGGVSLCRDLGIADELQGTDERNRRTYVVHDGNLHPMPEGLTGLVPSRVEPLLESNLFSSTGKQRLQMENNIPALLNPGDESLREFVTRRFGTEVYERLIEPLMAGIYAGNGAHLSLPATFPQLHALERDFGSILTAMKERSPSSDSPRRPAFLAPREGMQTIVDALGQQLQDVTIRTSAPVQSVKQSIDGHVVHLQTGDAIRTRSLIFATPAYAAADILHSLSEPLAHSLRAIPYVSSATVSLLYRKTAVASPLDGYGYVVPRIEGSDILACTWVSSKFTGRVPPGYVQLRVFIGRAGREEILQGSDDDLVQAARQEVERTVGASGAPEMFRVFRWPRGMPQYNVGHLERIASIRAAVGDCPGIFLAGAAYGGVGIPDCIRSGQSAADGVISYLNVHPDAR